MKRSTGAALFAVTLLAVAIRLSPLLRALHWGSDFGEYYALTRALVAGGVVPLEYDGWGITYPYFPGLYFINAAFAHAGVSIEFAANVVVPVLGGPAVLPLFLLAVRVTADDFTGLVAATFLGVSIFHAYPTSHGIPATLGDVLLLGALLMFVALRRSPKLFLPLVLTGLAIAITHHLATYVLLIAALASLLLRAALDRKLTLHGIRYEFAFLVILAGSALTSWVAFSGPFWTLITSETSVPVGAIFGGLALAIAAVPAAIRARHRLSWRFVPRLRSSRGAALAAGLAVATAVGIVGVGIAADVAGTTVRLEPIHVLVFAPTFVFLSFAASGRRFLDISREGSDVSAWFAILLLSVVLGVLAAPEVLIPYRHTEYLAIPVAVMVGIGFRWLTLAARPQAQAAAVVALVLLASGTAWNAIPPPSVLAGFDEGISPRSVESALWVRHHADGLIASDHRASSVMFGFGGVDATWDREAGMWHTTSVVVALAAMQSVELPDGLARVDWVVVDDGMRRGLQISPFAPAEPLTPEEVATFASCPFQKLFDSGYAQIYLVNWGRPCP